MEKVQLGKSLVVTGCTGKSNLKFLINPGKTTGLRLLPRMHPGGIFVTWSSRFGCRNGEKFCLQHKGTDFPFFKSIVLYSLQCHTRDMLGTIARLLPALMFARVISEEPTCRVIPEEIHLALGDTPSDMTVTWVTFVPTEDSYVLFWKVSGDAAFKAEGFCQTFCGGRTVRYIHRVVLRDLEPCTSYAYRCGSCCGESETYVFKTNPAGADWSPQLIIYGDLGWKGAVSFPYILRQALLTGVNAVVHVGDIAYNLGTADGFVGDQFLRMIEPLAVSVPYMTAVGNHEQFQNFSYYKALFSMPGGSDGYFYSFDMGSAHFIVISTEVYYFPEYGTDSIVTQYRWLQEDLARAASERSTRPWIIVLGHRPLYCSSDTGEDCSLDNSLLRFARIGPYDYGLESLFHQYEVDVIFSGHMHYYERSWPVYARNVYNGSGRNPYRNPGAPVHIITGAPGMISGTESVCFVRRDLFGFFSNEYSYSLLTVINKTHLFLEQVSTTRKGEVIDTMTLVKDCR